MRMPSLTAESSIFPLAIFDEHDRHSHSTHVIIRVRIVFHGTFSMRYNAVVDFARVCARLAVLGICPTHVIDLNGTTLISSYLRWPLYC